MTLDIVTSFIGLRLVSDDIRLYYQYDDPKDKDVAISSCVMISIVIFLLFSTLFYMASGYFSRIVFGSKEYTHLFRSSGGPAGTFWEGNI